MTEDWLGAWTISLSAGKQVLDFISRCVDTHGAPPTLREISAHIGIRGRLNLLGIRTCEDLGCFPVDILKIKFGVIGQRLHEMGRAWTAARWSRQTGRTKSNPSGIPWPCNGTPPGSRAFLNTCSSYPKW